MACGILVPSPGTEPMPSAVEARSVKCWTTRKVPFIYFFLFLNIWNIRWLRQHQWSLILNIWFLRLSSVCVCVVLWGCQKCGQLYVWVWVCEHLSNPYAVRSSLDFLPAALKSMGLRPLGQLRWPLWTLKSGSNVSGQDCGFWGWRQAETLERTWKKSGLG